MAADMAMGAAPGAAPGGAPVEEEGGVSPEASLEQMVSSVDRGIAQLAQLISQASPELGQQMQAVSDQFRGVIEQIAGGGGPEAAAPVSAQAGPGAVQQAF